MASQGRWRDEDFLDALAASLAGRSVATADGALAVVRLPKAAPKGEICFIEGGGFGKKALMAELKLGSSLHVEIGHRASWSAATARISGQSPAVYFNPDLTAEDAVRRWLNKGGSAAIAAVKLGPNEQVRTSQSQTDFVAQPTTPAEMAERIDAVIALARSLPPAPRERAARLPAAFAGLQPLAARWSISDDHERAETIRAARTATLRRLVDLVKPRLSAIDSALDSSAAAVPEDLIELQALALSAVEADLELARRSSDIPAR